MATFGDTSLQLGSGGAVFPLQMRGGADPFECSLDGGEVVFPGSGKYVVVRSEADSDFATARESCWELVNRALDIWLTRGGAPAAIDHRGKPYVVWWKDQSGATTLRLVGTAYSTARFSANVVVRDLSGNVLTQPPPPIVWVECMRYYRVSEASEDLFDSFRNLYLALESLLSGIIPPVVTAAGSEKETVWLGRALRHIAATADLSPFAPPSPKAAHNAIHDELWTTMRTAIFHAKQGRTVWMPQEWASRAAIVEARVRYSRLFRAVAEQHLGLRYPSGGFYRGFWEETAKLTLADQTVFVSDDPTPIPEQLDTPDVAPAGGSVLKLDTVPASDMTGPWCRGVIGSAPGSALAAKAIKIRRFGTVRGEELAMIDRLQESLAVDNIDNVEVALLMEGRNFGAPRQDFQT